MTTLVIEGKRVKVSDDFVNLSPEDQEKTVNEIAAQIGAQPSGPQSKHPLMSQLNKGIAESAGGLVNLINPFDQPHALNPFQNGTGSAVSGIENVMNAGGIETAQQEPQTLAGSFMRGSGNAAGSLLPVAASLNKLRAMGGAAGQLADEVYSSLATIFGAGTEVLAGGISETAAQVAEDAGAPEWVQNTAAIAAPMSLPLGAQAATGVAKRLPMVAAAKSGVNALKGEIAPFTKSGGQEVARRRAVELAGGRERADQLASRISKENPLNLTPAQQMDDPNMIALEHLAASQDPNLRARLEARGDASRAAAAKKMQAPGDIENTRSFFETRRREFTEELTARADDAIDRTQAGVDGVAPVRGEMENSTRTVDAVRLALAEETAREKELWDAIPRGAEVPTTNARATAERLIAETPRAQKSDIPQVINELLTDGGFGDVETVAEMHGLYSELRRVARSAMAGNDQRKNMARIANETAEAVLRDLGAVDGQTAIGQQINEARAFSAALHETFDRGAVGKVLKRTLDGDEAIEPELSLKRTVGRGGVEGTVSARQISNASPESDTFVQDYIKQRFQDAVQSPSGEFTSTSARRFQRENRDLLQRYPELARDIDEAVSARETAEQFAARIQGRIKALTSARQSAGAALLDGSPAQSLKAITEARNPARATRLLVNEANKDPSGEALAGLKSLLSSELIKPTGEASLQAIDGPRLNSALRQVFSSSEISRLKRLAGELAKLDRAQVDVPSIGTDLSGAKANKAIEYLARVIAARQGAEMGGGGGGSLQTAQMASSRVKEVLGRLTSDRASQMLADAVEDPELFRALLTDVGSPGFEKRMLPKFMPYLIGGASAQQAE